MVRSVFNVAAKEAGLDVVNPFSQVIFCSAPPGKRRAPIPINAILKIQHLCFEKDDEIRWLIALLSDGGNASG